MGKVGWCHFTATRHPAVPFLSGINVTTPTAPIGSALLTHTYPSPAIYPALSPPISSHKRLFVAQPLPATLVPSQNESHFSISSLLLLIASQALSLKPSYHLPQTKGLAILTNRRHMYLPILRSHFHWLLWTLSHQSLSFIAIQGHCPRTIRTTANSACRASFINPTHSSKPLPPKLCFRYPVVVSYELSSSQVIIGA